MENARKTFDVLCSMLDHKDWKYEKIEEDLVIKSGVSGDDFPIEFIMRVTPRNELVSFVSWMPYKIEESKRLDLALAVCAVNYRLADGSFDYNLEDGRIMFRLTSSYRNSTLSEELFDYMLMVSATTIDEYNDKFFMISKGMMTLQQFMESEQDEE